MNEIKFIDLFGGIGGFRHGLEKASNKYDCVWYCDKDKYATQTYNKNFKENYEPTDITTVETADIPDFDMLCGGFPCQSFSIAGKRKGFQDTRGTMFFEICRLVKEKRPSLLLLENVKGLLSADYGRCFATILLQLDELGYDVEWQVLNSKNFGVPQNQERVFIVGHLRGNGGGQVFPLRKDLGEDIGEEICTSGHKMEKRNQGGGSSTIPRQSDETIENNNTSRRRMQSNDTRYSFIDLSTQEPKLSKEARALQSRYWKGYSNRKAETSGIMIERFPLKFLTRNQKESDGDYSFTVDGANTGGVRVEKNIRRLTPVECERLQGFPDGWTGGVSDTQRYKQLGNAVTVNVIRAIGENIAL